MLFEKVHHILLARGVTPAAGSFALRNDGGGDYIAEWDVPSLGAEPTPQDLEAITEADLATVRIYQQDVETAAMLAAIDSGLITVIMEQFPAMVADAQAGTFRRDLWRQRLRSRVRVVRRRPSTT